MNRPFLAVSCAIWIAWGALVAAETEVALAEAEAGDTVVAKLKDHTLVTGVLANVSSSNYQIKTSKSLVVLRRSDVLSIKRLDGDKRSVTRNAGQTPLANLEEEPEDRERNTKLGTPGKADGGPRSADAFRPILPPAGRQAAEAPEQKLLEKLAEPHPSAPMAAEEKLTPEQAEEAEKLNQRLGLAIHLIEKGGHFEAAQALKQIGNSGIPSMIAKADAEMRKRFHRGMDEMIAMAYLLEKCQPCKASGMEACDQCGGSGYLSRVIERTGSRVRPGSRDLESAAVGILDKINAEQFVRDQLCDKCRGHGFHVCTACLATQRRFVAPSPYERAAYSDRLLGLGDSLLGCGEQSYGDTNRESPPTYETREDARLKPMLEQIWIRDSINKVKSDLLRLFRAKQYYEWALKADPSVVYRTSRDYPHEITKLEYRLKNLYAEWYAREEVYRANRLENRLDELNYYENFAPGLNGTTKTGSNEFRRVLEKQ